MTKIIERFGVKFTKPEEIAQIELDDRLIPEPGMSYQEKRMMKLSLKNGIQIEAEGIVTRTRNTSRCPTSGFYGVDCNIEIPQPFSMLGVQLQPGG